MRTLSLFLFMFISLMSFNSIAIEPIVEPHVMIYYQVPFGGSNKNMNKHTFGFRMDRTVVVHGEAIDYQSLMKQPAVFDLKMGRDGIDSLYISGTDYLEQYRLYKVHRVNGEEEIMTEPAEGEVVEEDLSSVEEDVSEEEVQEEEEYDGLTIGGILDETHTGWLLGLAIGIVLLSGVGG